MNLRRKTLESYIVFIKKKKVKNNGKQRENLWNFISNVI